MLTKRPPNHDTTTSILPLRTYSFLFNEVIPVALKPIRAIYLQIFSHLAKLFDLSVEHSLLVAEHVSHASESEVVSS